MAGDDIDYGTARITLTLDDTGVVADARDLATRIQRALDRGTRTIGAQIRRNIQRGLDAAAVTVRVEPDLRRFDAALLRGLRTLDSINLPVAPDVTGFVERLRAALAGEEVTVRVVPDLDDFDARIRAHNAPDVTVRVNTDVDADRFSRALSGLARVAGQTGTALTGLMRIGAVGIAAAGAATGVASLTAALTPPVGIIAAYPAAIAGFQVALGTLKLAVLGVSDAMSALAGGDAAKFQQALDKLAPAAQTAVLAVRDLAPELREVQQSIQQAFFKEFADDVGAAVRNLLPLRAQLAALATEFGKAADQGLKFAASQQAAAPLRAIIEGTAQAASGLQTAIAPLAKGFLDVAAAVAQALGPQVGQAIGQVGAQIGTALSAFAESGRAVDAVRGALDTFRQLGQVASNVGGIISGIFQAAGSAGGGLLGNLQNITGAMDAFVNSARGQEAIGNIFGAIRTVAAELGPILSAVVTQIGAIAPAVAPIFTELGPAIAGIINALGPAVASILPAVETLAGALADALAGFGPALGPIAEGFASMVSGLSPLLPLLGQLAGIVGGVLGAGLQNIMAFLTPVIQALSSALLPILPPLSDAFLSLVAAFRPLYEGLGQGLATLIQGLAPLLLTLAGAVVQLVNAFLPLIQQVMAALMPILPPIVQAFTALVQAVMPLVPPIVSLVAALAPLVGQLITMAAPILQIGAAFLSWVAINVVVPIIQGIVTVLSGIINIVSSVVTAVMSFVTRVIGFFTSLGSSVKSAVSSMISAVVGFFAGLPGRAAGALSALGSRIAGVFRSAAGAAKGAVLGLISGVVSLFSGVAGKVGGALSNVGSKIAGVFRSAVAGVKGAVSGLISGVVGLFSGLGSKIVSALGNIAGKIVSKIKNGLPSAIKSVLPFAEGGLVTSPVIGLVGEAGPELILPLTKPQRAKQLAEQANLAELLGWDKATPEKNSSGGVTIAPVFNMTAVGDPEMTARRVLRRLSMAYTL